MAETPGEELRSIEAHNYEWLCYDIIASVTGHTRYEVYENMAARVLKVIDEDGDLAYIKPSSLPTRAHSEYLEEVKRISAEFGILLPEPSRDKARQYQVKKLLNSINATTKNGRK